MVGMFTVAFWKATGERALKAFASTAGALLSANPIAQAIDPGPNIFHLDALTIGQVSLTAALISVLLSLGSAAISNGTPSLTNAETLPPVPPADPGA